MVGLGLTACASARADVTAPASTTAPLPTTVAMAHVPLPSDPVAPSVVAVTAAPATPPPARSEVAPATSEAPTAAPTEPPAPAATVWPPYEPLPGVAGLAALTGLAAGPELETTAALAVKIDNHPGARPQWGLEAADLVVEENVEGVTRFVVAVFHSRQPSMIGPVRSARTSDLAVLASLNRPILAWSGGERRRDQGGPLSSGRRHPRRPVGAAGRCLLPPGWVQTQTARPRPRSAVCS